MRKTAETKYTAVCNETAPTVDALYNTTDQIETVEDGKLQFARQLYDEFLERRGEDHRDTRLLRKYILTLTNRARTPAPAERQVFD
jgi:hypothetical protein